MTTKTQRMTVHSCDGVSVLDLGAIEIWDGADLALLRETLHRLIAVERRRSVGVDLRSVKYIPSGFFGMLFDWHDRGVQVSLYDPQDNVARMLWFRQFFDHVSDGRYVLRDEPVETEILFSEAEHQTAEAACR